MLVEDPCFSGDKKMIIPAEFFEKMKN